MKRLLAIGLILLVFVVACGKKEVKKTSTDSKLTTEAFAVADQIREAYVMNNRAVIERYTTRDGYASITNARKSFDSAELTFNPGILQNPGY